MTTTDKIALDTNILLYLHDASAHNLLVEKRLQMINPFLPR